MVSEVIFRIKSQELTTKPGRTKPEDDGPHVNQEKRRECVINDGEASDLLVHIEAVTLNDIRFGKNQKAVIFLSRNTDRRPYRLSGRECICKSR